MKVKQHYLKMRLVQAVGNWFNKSQNSSLQSLESEQKTSSFIALLTLLLFCIRNMPQVSINNV